MPSLISAVMRARKRPIFPINLCYLARTYRMLRTGKQPNCPFIFCVIYSSHVDDHLMTIF